MVGANVYLMPPGTKGRPDQPGLFLVLPGEDMMRGEALVLCYQIGDLHLVAELAVH